MADRIHKREMRVIDEVLSKSPGYVLNFSDRTFGEFFDQYGIDIDHENFRILGNSKGKRLRCFLQTAPLEQVTVILKQLLAERTRLNWEDTPLLEDYRRIIGRLRAGDASPNSTTTSSSNTGGRWQAFAETAAVPAKTAAALQSAGDEFAPTPQSGTETFVTLGYDLFLAHPSGDNASARALYELLQPDVRVFLDERSLAPGARWHQEIPAAQRASRATAILISSHADAAWYLGDEVVTAIRLHRAAPDAHGLVPILLEPGLSPPYGLSHVQAIVAAEVGGLVGVAARLRHYLTGPRVQAMPLPAIATIADDSAERCDHVRLHDRLLRITDTMFEQILFYVRLDRSQIAPRTAKLAERILDVAQLAAYDVELCRRLAAELDQRAPWTR